MEISEILRDSVKLNDHVVWQTAARTRDTPAVLQNSVVGN
jgi:hypothetical protein